MHHPASFAIQGHVRLLEDLQVREAVAAARCPPEAQDYPLVVLVAVDLYLVGATTFGVGLELAALPMQANLRCSCGYKAQHLETRDLRNQLAPVNSRPNKQRNH